MQKRAKQSLSAVLTAFRELNAQLPISSLPHELLSDIFHLACIAPDPASDHPFTVKEAINTKILRSTRHSIAGVCHYWRTIVLETRSLWTSIAIESDRDEREYRGDDEGEDLQPEPDRPWRTALFPSPSLLALELERSAPLPLQVSIWCQHTTQKWRSIVDLFSLNWGRCESIVLVIGKVDVAVFLLQWLLSGTVKLPLLHSLSLHLEFSRWREPIVVDLSACTNLRRLVLRDCAVRGHCPQAPVQELVLEDVIDHSDRVHINLAVLKSVAPHLRMLRWRFHDKHMSHLSIPYPFPVLSLPNLETLDFDVDVDEHQHIICSVDAPNLTQLRLRNHYHSLSVLVHFPHIDQFPALEVLEVVGNFDATGLLECIKYLPNLELLILMAKRNVSETIIDNLLARQANLGGGGEGEFEVVPQLRKLVARMSASRAEELVVSRSRGAQQAETLIVPFKLLVPFVGEVPGDMQQLQTAFPRFISFKFSSPFASLEWCDRDW